MIQTLRQACSPRRSVFDPSVRDTVYSIDDLPTIDARAFFAENYVTEGMRQLLTDAFARLEGKNQNTSGAYLLSQSMGGGKTHNLIALGLLARHPELRRDVMAGFYEPGPLGAVRVLAFHGRKNTEFGIWGDLAKQLNREQDFKHLYTPLQPPGDDDWVSLLAGQPTLVMFDELPPYLESALGREVGQTTLADLTVRALANLLVAVSSGKLPNVCLVLTDLSGSAYSLASAKLGGVLSNLENEANRTVQRIAPVRLNSPEVYNILRTRLFEVLPGEAAVAEIADAHAGAVEDARKVDLTTASPQQLRGQIVQSYPFHPGLQDLYARFRENQGFQQTRALIRLMRITVANLWEEGGAADRNYLIGAQDLDLHDAAVVSEVNQINNRLENAIAHDIASEGAGSVAETIDAGQGTAAQDAATLIFVSSLSTATNPTLGLSRGEIVAYLTSPRRDLTGLTRALDELQTHAWYLHATADGRLLFKNTENLNAKLESYARGVSREDRERGLRERMQTMFEPKVKDLYQTLEAIPAFDQVQLSADRVTLVVVRPDSAARVEMEAFWGNQQFKNRVLFLTARQHEYQPILEHMGYIRAIDTILAEFANEGLRDLDPQVQEAREIRTKHESRFYMTFREAFQTLLYPGTHGLIDLELDPKYVSNAYNGETQIRQALVEVHKFRDGADEEQLRKSVENRLWPPDAKEASWNEIKRKAAQDPSWVMHHPRALDDLKDALVKKDLWRDLGNGFVQRGPFPKPAPAVKVQLLSRDPETGQARLRIQPLNGDRVRMSDSGPATPSSEQLTEWELVTDKLNLSFLAESSDGASEPGTVQPWTNSIEVKYRVFQAGDQRMCELRAIPAGAIRYTVDGASPKTSGIAYDAPFPIGPGRTLLLAYAAAEGIESDQLRQDIPAQGDKKILVDPARPARWTRKLSRDSTSETFELLNLLAAHRAELAGLRVDGSSDGHYWEVTTDAGSPKPVGDIRRVTDLMLELFPGRNITLDVEALDFSLGQDLIDLVAALKTTLQDNEVKQTQ